MADLDLKKELKHLYNPPAGQVTVVDVPPLAYLMIDGAGDPNTSEVYAAAVEALYTLAYSVRAISKRDGLAFTVMPLEGLWWFDQYPDEPVFLTPEHKARFKWTMIILQPEHVTAAMVEQARRDALKKKNLPALESIRFETLHEGTAAQIMHLGSYAAELPTVTLLHNYIRAHGTLHGLHHEIYLSDPRRVEPDKLKTVIRQPFRPA